MLLIFSGFFVALGYTLCKKSKSYHLSCQNLKDDWKLYTTINLLMFVYGSSCRNSEKNENDLIITGYLAQHYDTCLNMNCPCRMEKVFHSKKQKYIKLTNKFIKNRFILKTIILNNLWCIMMNDKSDKSPAFYIYFSEFVFVKFHNYTMALKMLKKAE